MFGNTCYNNMFGNDCNNNTFGNACGYNTFGNSCNSNTFGNAYIQYCSFGDGVSSCTTTGYTSGSYIQYVIVLNGTSSTELSGLETSVSYSQTCGKNSSGVYTHKNVLD